MARPKKVVEEAAVEDKKSDTPKSKEADLKKILSNLNSKLGANAIQLGGVPPIQRIPCDFFPMDYLSGGGIPRARWTQLWGSQSCGKTTMSLKYAAQVQKEGGKVVFVDAEHALDPAWAAKLGVDVEAMYYSRPKSLEEAETYVQDLAPFVDLIIIDSVVAVSGEKELRAIEKEGSISKDSMMVVPAALSKFFRVVTPILGKSNCGVILINQTRVNAGGYVAFDDFSGGNALRHNLGFSIHLREGAKADRPMSADKKTVLGKNIVAKINKTKIGGAPEGTTASFTIWYDEPHLRNDLELLTGALSLGVIERNGPTYKFNGESIAIGWEKTLEAVANNPDLFGQIKDKVFETIKK